MVARPEGDEAEDDVGPGAVQDRMRRPGGGLRKRSIVLAGHATSVALEPEFWAALEALAAVRGASLAGLIAAIDQGRGDRPLASACRVAALTGSRPASSAG
jgi:predicted DNA-binding ribbon-helix-helix protein